MILRFRSLVAFITVVPILALALAACSTKQAAAPDPTKKPAEVKIAVVRPSEIARTLEVTGSVVPFRAVQLASPAEGPVVSLRVREGDPVQKGDTLLVIGRQEGAEAQIASLLEAVRKEDANVARVERLLAIEGNSREQLEQAKAAREQARALLVKAQESARDYSVLAPWSGVTSRLFVEEGDYNYISPRKPLLELYDPSSLVVQLSIAEQYAAHLQLKSPVSVSLDAYPDTVFHGIVTRIYPYLDERMRTRTVEVTVDRAAKLLPGMFARTKLKTGTVKDALVVPTQAIVTTPDAKTVAYVAVNGKAQRKEVSTGIEEGSRVQIVQGLLPGDSVIITGVMGLSDGRLIIATSASADEPGASLKSSAKSGTSDGHK